MSHVPPSPASPAPPGAAPSSNFGPAAFDFASARDVDEFVERLGQFERGEITSDEWRAFRLLRGAYGQRQEGQWHMLRVKLPAGYVRADQLRTLAQIAEETSRGFGHITTRQNVQFHFIPLDRMAHALRLAQEAGITSKSACGNSVRTITACPYAGVSPTEAFDVTPFCNVLTRFLLDHPLSSSLPRKFKMAFEGCPDDHAHTAIHDIGYWATWRTDAAGAREPGFRITVGGGTANMCKSGSELFAFVPIRELFDATEAVIRVFHKHGDRQHRHRARMKFLIKSAGWEAFVGMVHAELSALRTSSDGVGGGTPCEVEVVESAPYRTHRADRVNLASIAARVEGSQLKGPGIVPTPAPRLQIFDTAYETWLATNVVRQRQAGFSAVAVTVTRGDLTGEQFRVLAELAELFGDGTVRFTIGQNLVWQWVPDARVRDLYAALAAAGLAAAGAESLADPTSCPGAESCKLAVTQSRGLARLLGDHLQAHPELADPGWRGSAIKMSGCPNGCGQHHIATLGFQGAMRKLGDAAVPQYFVMVGGRVARDGARFGTVIAKIPARRIPAAVDRLLAHYRAHRDPGETASEYFARIEPKSLAPLIKDLEALTPETATPEDFIDLGEATRFVNAIGEGECAS